jgi:hypothetical protein
MKKHLEKRNERLFNKLFENQGVVIKELGVPEMTAWQAIEEEEELEEEETLEEVQGVVIDPESASDDEEEDEGSLDNPEEEELSDEEVDDLVSDAGL